MRRSLVLAIAGLLLLGACGSSGSESATTTTTNPPGTSADQRLARAGLLQEGDLPGFQKVTPSTSEAADLPKLGLGIPECKGFIDAISIDIVQGRSPGFQRNTAIVNSSAAVYKDAAAASAQIEAWRDPGITACLQKVYEKGIKGGTVDVSPIGVNTPAEDQFGFRVTVTNGAQKLLTDIVGLRVGRAVFSLNVFGSEAESAEVQSTALPKVVARVRAAGG